MYRIGWGTQLDPAAKQSQVDNSSLCTNLGNAQQEGEYSAAGCEAD
jgi:hypothetical protein